MARRRNYNDVRVCNRCGREGTHQFTKDERGHTICQNFTACKRRYMQPIARTKEDNERGRERRA